MGLALWHSDLQGRGVTEMLLGPLKRCTEPEISAKRRWQRNLGNIFSELLCQPIEHSREGSIWRVNSQITGVVHPFLHVLAWLLKKAYLETKTYVLLHNWVERRQELGKRGAFCGAPFRSIFLTSYWLRRESCNAETKKAEEVKLCVKEKSPNCLINGWLYISSIFNCSVSLLLACLLVPVNLAFYC